MEIRVSLTDFRAHLSEVVGKVEFGSKKVVIERFGVPTAACVPMDDLARIYRAEAEEIATAVKPRTGVRGALATVGRILGIDSDANGKAPSGENGAK